MSKCHKLFIQWSRYSNRNSVVSLNTNSEVLQPAPEKPRVEPKKFVKIGRPGYRVTKQREPESAQQSLLFQVDYPGEYSQRTRWTFCHRSVQLTL